MKLLEVIRRADDHRKSAEAIVHDEVATIGDLEKGQLHATLALYYQAEARDLRDMAGGA